MSMSQKAVSKAAAIRLRQRLHPEGGAGDKIFPPTFSGGVYCWEVRKQEGKEVQCVLLDSVASQANRLEEALASATAAGLNLPELRVDFSKEFPEIGPVSVLAAPHRVFDAIVRDSEVAGKAFSKSPLYAALAASTTRNANAIFENSPSALLFGCWDSTGAAGGLGNKFARAMTSEIVGIDASWGETRGGVRADPLQILAAASVTSKDSQTWEVAKGAKAEKVVRPSEINHGNILVSTDSTKHQTVIGDSLVEQSHSTRGGVTVDHALQISVISVNALRRLRFPTSTGAASSERDSAAQRVLLALGLFALTLLRESGYWLRSRCGLVADGFAEFELVYGDGRVETFAFDSSKARAEFDDAVTAAKAAGLGWNDVQILTPQPKLVELIKKSRELQALGKVEG
jgi:CRISPR-associated protein Csb1